jgi:hypothetical protein
MSYTVRKTHPTADAPGAPTDHHKESLEDALQSAHDYITIGGAESVTITSANSLATPNTDSLLVATVTRCEHGGVSIQATYARIQN